MCIMRIMSKTVILPYFHVQFYHNYCVRHLLTPFSRIIHTSTQYTKENIYFSNLKIFFLNNVLTVDMTVLFKPDRHPTCRVTEEGKYVDVALITPRSDFK